MRAMFSPSDLAWLQHRTGEEKLRFVERLSRKWRIKCRNQAIWWTCFFKMQKPIGCGTHTDRLSPPPPHACKSTIMTIVFHLHFVALWFHHGCNAIYLGITYACCIKVGHSAHWHNGLFYFVTHRVNRPDFLREGGREREREREREGWEWMEGFPSPTVMFWQAFDLTVTWYHGDR